MKIVEKKKKDFSICFENMDCGEIFEYDGTYWMKVYHDLKDEYYAVNIPDGEICDEFEPTDICRVIETELHILD